MSQVRAEQTCFQTTFNKLKYLDIIGKEIQFRVEDSEKYKTNLGGVLTILIGIFLVLSVYLFGRDIVERENPSFLFRKIRTDNYPFMTLNKTNYFFGIRIGDNSGDFISDKRYFDMIYKYEYFTKNNETNDLDLQIEHIEELKPCTLDDIASNYTYNSEGLSSFYCAKIYSKNYSLGGSWGQDKIGIISYQVRLCSNETQAKYNITCATPEERFKRYEDKFFVEVKNLNYVLNPSNFQEPLKAVVDYQPYVVDLHFGKYYYYFYSKSVLSTDIGVFQSDKLYNNYTQVEKVTTDIVSLGSNNLVFQSEIQFTNLRLEYERVYIKAQGIAATIGGFVSIVYYIISGFYYFYIDVHLQNFWYENLLNLKINLDGEVFCIKEPSKEASEGHVNDKTPRQHRTGSDITEMKIIPFETEEKLNSDKRETVRSQRNPINEIQADTDNEKQTQIKESIQLITNAKEIGKIEVENMAEFLVRKKTSNNLKAIRNSKENKFKALLDFNKRPRKEYDPGRCVLFNFRFCLCACSNKINKARTKQELYNNQIVYKAEYNISKKLDAVNILHLFDQMKLLKQIFFNEHQCFMLENLGKKLISNDAVVTRKDFTKIIDVKQKIEEKNLIKYLKEEKKNKIDDLDLYLIDLLSDDLKNRVLKEIEL